MKTGHDLKGLIKFLGRDDWQHHLEAVVAEHFGPASAATGRRSSASSSTPSRPMFPDGLDVHLVLDNAGTHKTKLIRNWLAKRPRWHVHFTPTSASWIDRMQFHQHDCAGTSSSPGKAVSCASPCIWRLRFGRRRCRA